MAYFSSDAPLPQNSLDPPPAWKAAASDARKAFFFNASRTGRERVYADLPSLDSFFQETPGLAVDAAQIVPASELARQSVLNGLVPLGTQDNATALGATSPSGQPIFGAPPVVLSLNAPGGQTTASQDYFSSTPIMPVAAPVPSQYGFMDAPSANVPAKRKHLQTSEPGASLPCPPKRGFAGYAPPWSDAYAMVEGNCPAAAGSTGFPWVMLAIFAGGLIGLSYAGKKGRR